MGHVEAKYYLQDEKWKDKLSSMQMKYWVYLL